MTGRPPATCHSIVERRDPLAHQRTRNISHDFAAIPLFARDTQTWDFVTQRPWFDGLKGITPIERNTNAARWG
jgi:hypothetical protein